MSFKHYLITRFNIFEKEWRPWDKHRCDVRTDEWMEHRFELFERYCLPSVLEQTALRFQWIVLFDTATPQHWLDKINATAGPYLPLYVTGHWLHELQVFLRGGRQSEWIITTRLDNDDIISPNYLALVQQQFNRQRFLFVDAPSGYRLSEGELYEHQEPFNPFMSLIERASRKTVLHVPHGRAIRQHPHVLVPGRQWVQVIHKTNYSNDGIHGDSAPTPSWLKRYV